MEFALPKDLDKKSFVYLVENSMDVESADAFIARIFPKSIPSNRFDILCKYFDFQMIDRLLGEEQSADSIKESDYWFTLQHIINRAR